MTHHEHALKRLRQANQSRRWGHEAYARIHGMWALHHLRKHVTEWLGDELAQTVSNGQAAYQPPKVVIIPPQ